MTTNTSFRRSLIGLLLAVSLFVASGTLASNSLSPETDKNLKEQDIAFINSSGLGTASPTIVVSQIIKFVLGFLGVVFIILIIYAGFTWMTSAGNEDKISKAKMTMTAAVIGLIIVLAAFAITVFVLDYTLRATGVSSGGLDGAG